MTQSLMLVATGTARIAGSWPWYLVRGSGFVAVGLLVLLMLSGIGQVTGLTYRVLEPLKAWALHKAMAYALLASIALHVAGILFDHFVSFSLVQVLVPFTSSYSNGVPLLGLSLAVVGVALGVLAMYLVIIVVLTSLGWIETKKRAWRLTHYLSYATMLFVAIHGLAVGTDLTAGFGRFVWLAVSALLLLAIISRLWRAGTIRRRT